MHRKKLLGALVLALVPCGRAATVATVDLSRVAFSPAAVTINAGDTVTFHLTDVVPEILQSISGPDTFLSPTLLQGQNFSLLFQNPGVDFYQDLATPGHTGAVVIRPATGPAVIPINISRNAFDLPSLTIVAGDTVVWHENDVLPVVLSTNQGSPSAFESPVVLQGGTFSFTFQTPGTVSYLDLVNTVRAGTITVLPAPAPPPPAPTPEPVTLGISGIGLLALGGLGGRLLHRQR